MILLKLFALWLVIVFGVIAGMVGWHMLNMERADGADWVVYLTGLAFYWIVAIVCLVAFCK